MCRHLAQHARHQQDTQVPKVGEWKARNAEQSTSTSVTSCGARKLSAKTGSATIPAKAWARRQDRGAGWDGHIDDSFTSRCS
jgi:hypothetical protein